MSNEREAYIRTAEASVRAFYDALAPDYARWITRYRYYYERKIRILRHVFPNPGRVLEIGCGLGQNLAGLRPEYGLGIDCSEALVAEARRLHPRDRFPNLEFRCMSALDTGQLEETFDTILLVNTLTEIPELLTLFKGLHRLCGPHTRVLHLTHNYILGPVIKLGGALGICPKRPNENWLTKLDFQNIVNLSNFQTVREGFDLLVPVGILGLSNFINRYGPLIPGAKHLCMLYYTVMRPMVARGNPGDFSVTVCVPCKDEEDNIAGLVERIPEMGRGTEIIFVDDRSSDATAARVEQQIHAHPEKNIRLVEGPGEGKGAACRAGFAHASHDVLVILDADMTVMPEDLPPFLEALASGKGEFINGSRLIYPLERDSMRFANIVGNNLFAMMFSFLLSQHLKDTLCGTKVIWRGDYPKILASREYLGNVDKWGDYDWVFGAARHNLQIIELPVHYRNRKTGQTKMTKRFRNALTMLKMCCVAFRKLKLI